MSVLSRHTAERCRIMMLNYKLLSLKILSGNKLPFVGAFFVYFVCLFVLGVCLFLLACCFLTISVSR